MALRLSGCRTRRRSSSAGSRRCQTPTLAVQAGAWAIGLIFWPHSPRRCELQDGRRDRRGAEAPGRDRRRVRQSDARRGRSHGGCGGSDDAPAAWRGGPGVLFRGCPAHRLQGDQGRTRAQPRRHPVAGAVSHRLSPARQLQPPEFRAAPARRSAWEIARGHRGTVPMILSGGLNPDNVAEAIARGAAVRGRCGQRGRAQRPAARIPTSCGHLRRRSPRPRRRATRARDERDRAPLRPVRRAIRPGDADAGAGRSSRTRGCRRGRTPSSARGWMRCCATTWAGRRRCTWRRA